ncbi:sulfite oxidase heme-binding subunit YedZ [Paracoccus endophyticus]|uniref:sulfite oxidase heme-binding subunit YedZ n=1 Tax=Paracoccus endophyticus TaxID=2233774 RepID=UPI000DD538EE|nr:protein-methionine-sulfoxide reductase heme-binding subunit MsrQ [Paracoccus endophyticus]
MDRIPGALADRLRRLPIWSVWLLGSIPLALLVWDVLVGAVGVDPVRDIEHRLGRTTLYLVLVTLCVTPLLRLGRINLIRLRRPLGLLAFSYGVLHVLAWAVLDMGLLWQQAARDILKRPYLTFGMAGFVILAILAVTSSDSMIRRLGPKRWKAVHRLVYAAVLLGILHWLWAYKLWPPKGLAVGAGAVLLLGLRLPGVSRWLGALKKRQAKPVI